MNTNFKTSNIALAAYLKLKGLRLTECSRDDKFCFVFEDPDGVAKELEIEFVNSDMRKYDDEMRSLKNMIYSKN